MYIDMFNPEPFALLVGNDNEEKILKLPLLAKKQEDNTYINANGAKGEIDKKGYLANALKDYDETLVEAFMRDFKERYKIEKLYYLLDDNIKNFEFAKIKHKISLYFKDAKFYPKSVALGISFLFENKLKKDNRLCYNGVHLVVKENHKSKTFNHWGLVLERQKSDDSKKAFILQDSFIKKALKNFKIALGLEKEGFILYKECLPKLSMEVIKDGRFKNFEIIKDKTILGDKETLEIETPFTIPKGRESLALPLILDEEKIAYQGKITSKDFPLENDEEYKLTLTYDTGTEFNYVLGFKPVNNDLKPIVIEWQRIDTKGVELPTPDPIKKPSIDELKNDFNPKIDQEICFKILSIVARASWNNEKFLKNLMDQTNLEQQKGFLKRIEECLKNPKSYFSSACELLLAFLSYRNAKRELELIPESERTMRLLDSIDKAIKEEVKIESFVKLELKHQSFKNIPPLLLALRLYLRGDLEGVGIEIKGTEEDE
ncbi:hypothetical protein HG568_04645 [Helicobacter pylori]|uniref:hypothetical protein n=1 Tax=Helicobacter pylori TaxID=210 RepID=UPI0019213F1F|nr:hypothetical protein [Helicobacter pylori]QQW85824.1 hypothetical protein HG568_04645 [Helicobacter pylori]